MFWSIFFLVGAVFHYLWALRMWPKLYPHRLPWHYKEKAFLVALIWPIVFIAAAISGYERMNEIKRDK